MLKNYTIAGPKSLEILPFLDVAQFTLNSRTYPAKRNTVSALNAISKACLTNIFVHYDFIYIASRYAMFKTNAAKKAIIDEITDIIHYSATDPRICGIVMHTDFPIAKDVISNPTEEVIRNKYTSNIWDFERILSLRDKLGDMLRMSITEFCYDLKARFLPEYETKCKVYFENTTKVSFVNNVGRYRNLIDIVKSIPDSSRLFGVCLDTEHFFAVEGYFPSISEVTYAKELGIPVMVHLNPIPAEVKPCSRLDRHSETTLAECSVNDLEYYITYTSILEELNVPYLREVTEEAFQREQQIPKLWKQM